MGLFVHLFAPRNLWHGVLTFGIWLCFFNIVYFAMLTVFARAPLQDLMVNLQIGVLTCTPFLAIALLMLRYQLVLQIKLDGMARTDQLTGLANRHAFADHAEKVSGRAQDAIILMLDVDHFKQINDRFGHDLGDFCLQELAVFFRTQLREGDFIARMGGEEFAVLLHDTAMEDAMQIAGRLAKGSAIRIGRQDVRVTTSVGCARHHAGATLDAALNMADTALYRAKADGRACARSADDNPRDRGGDAVVSAAS